MMNYTPITHREALRHGVKSLSYFHTDNDTPVLPRENSPIESLKLVEWSTFDEDISRYLDKPELQRTYSGYSEISEISESNTESDTEMTNKDEIQTYSVDTCMTLVIDSFQEMGYDVNALKPTRTSVVGKPDIIVTTREELPKPRALIEYRAPSFAISTISTSRGLRSLIESNRSYGTLHNLTPVQKEFYNELHQISGYIEMNYLQHGVLSTHNNSFFLRRRGAGGKLEISRAVFPNDPLRINFPEAMHWLAFECIVKENWLYSYLNGFQMTTHLTPTLVGSSYPPNDPHRLFRLSSTSFHRIFELTKPIYNSERCTVFEGYMNIDSANWNTCEPKKVAVKIVDHKDLVSVSKLMIEIQNYEILEALQGTVLLRVLAYLSFCDLIDVLVLDGVGEKVIDWNDDLRREAAIQLENLHEIGFLHGEVKERNFIQTAKGLCIVNLGSVLCRATTVTKLAEMHRVSMFV